MKRNAFVLFTSFSDCFYGVSIPDVSSTELGGVIRLKMPSDAPSRSTLKLEDAISNMLKPDERERIFSLGAKSVDLGACPGGWTYQLVKRGMHVEAIDNGDIAENLMKTGQVEHFNADGFSYTPRYGSVTLLVCDMIEQPDRVAKLMLRWLVKGWTQHAIFNLKLPMKQCFLTVQTCLALLNDGLAKTGKKYRLAAKHLYHDRDEVTVVLIHS